MPATPSRIAFIKQGFRSVILESATVQARFGPLARDTLDQPMETYFEDMDDVNTIAAERFALLSGERRRFDVTLGTMLNFSGGLAFSQVTPTVTLIDDEKVASGRTCIVTEIAAHDYEAGRTRLGVWG